MLHDFDMENSNSEVMFQVAMIIDRVSSTSIGMTALKFFVIDKQSILTVSMYKTTATLVAIKLKFCTIMFQ